MKNKNFIGSNKKSESAKEIFKIKEGLFFKLEEVSDEAAAQCVGGRKSWVNKKVVPYGPNVYEPHAGLIYNASSSAGLAAAKWMADRGENGELFGTIASYGVEGAVISGSIVAGVGLTATVISSVFGIKNLFNYIKKKKKSRTLF